MTIMFSIGNGARSRALPHAQRRSRASFGKHTHELAFALLLFACSSNTPGAGQNYAAGGAVGASGFPTMPASNGGVPSAGTGGMSSLQGGGAPSTSSGAGGVSMIAAGGSPVVAMGGTAGMVGGSGAAGMAGVSSAGAGGASVGGASGASGASGAAGAGAGGASQTCTPMGMPGSDPCMSSLKANDDRLCKFTYNGAQRQFYMYATPAFDPCKPASLIMDCHGLSESAEVQAGKAAFTLGASKFPNGYGSSWRMAVQKENAIVVTPQGVNNSWTPATDVGFVNKAADIVEAVANVNKDHVYVTGISMGGQMTVATGCADATRWRGMAPVSMLTQGCTTLAKPTPVISFHSTTDQLTSYTDDRNLMQTMATLNHCKTGHTDSDQYGGAMSSTEPVCFVTSNGVGAPDAPDPLHIPLQQCQASAPASKCIKWTGCDDGVEVEFCTVVASTQPLGGHILYNNDTSLDLSEVAWRFLKKFQM